MRDFVLKKLDGYFLYLENIKTLSPLTIKTYKLNLDKALKNIVIEREGNVLIANLIPYRTKIMKQNKKTISKKISCVRSFLSYLEDIGYPMRVIGDNSIRVPKTLPKPLSYENIKKALNSSSLIERVLILFLYGFGLRISEVANLKVKNIRDKWLRVTGKGGKQRDLPMIKNIFLVYKEYTNKFMPRVYLFERKNKKVGENSLRYMLCKNFSRVGIKATPHMLRHSFATDMLNSGGRITDISKLLGHSFLSTTEVYTKLNSSFKLKSYLNSHPLCSKRV